MSSKRLIGNERSDGAQTRENEAADTGECPECSTQVISDGFETYCEECGLVVRMDATDPGPTRGAHGPRRIGPKEWAVEPNTPFRVNRGLGSKYNLGKDGQGRVLSAEAKRKFGRMQKFNKRLSKRKTRLNEGLRDVEMLGGNLALPGYVTEEAAWLLRRGAEARLPGGRMAWEALAGGAVVLATRNAGVAREIDEITAYAKTSEERLCAAARKLRIELGLIEEFPPVRTGCVEAVGEAIPEGTVDPWVREDLRWLGKRLLFLADERGIGPGTPRMSVAGAAVYAATRLLGERPFTQAELAEIASRVLETSKSRIATYSRELFDAYVDEFGSDDPGAILAASPMRGRAD